MKLLLRREQKSTLVGKAVFSLTVRADLTEDEKANIKKYKLGDSMLYERMKTIDPGSGLLGLASRMAMKMINMSISVRELESGKTIECRDIVEMLAVEDQIKEAAHTFKAVLHAASTFGGEEVVDLT